MIMSVQCKAEPAQVLKDISLDFDVYGEDMGN